MYRALGRATLLLALLAAPSGAPAAPDSGAASATRASPPPLAPDSREPLWIEAADAVSGKSGSGKTGMDLAPLIRGLERSIVRLSAAGLSDPARRAHATGFVISPGGYLLTSDALLTNARNLRARFEDGRELPVELIGRDPNTEIALLRIDPARLAAEGIELVPLALGESHSLRVGDGVVTLGHGDSEGSSAAQGIVAGRDLRIAPLGRSVARYLRLDMLLIAGFGGAPLVDLRGRVVGIISGDRMGGTELDSISFAVPIEAAKSVLPDLARSRLAASGWLGVQVQSLNDELAARLGISDGGGALVSQVLKDSPAEKAHIEKGDVILEFAGQPVRASRDLSAQVGRTQPGSDVTLLVLRRGARKELHAVIEPKLQTASGARGWGFECEELTRELALRLSLPETSRGVVVARVDPGGPAQQASLQVGDRVLAVNGKPLESLEALNTELRSSTAQILLIERAERARFVELSR
jgi:serine protease Do